MAPDTTDSSNPVADLLHRNALKGMKIMTQDRVLQDSELDAVTGGSFDLGNIVAKATIGAATSSGPPDVWVGCAWVPQWW